MTIIDAFEEAKNALEQTRNELQEMYLNISEAREGLDKEAREMLQDVRECKQVAEEQDGGDRFTRAIRGMAAKEILSADLPENVAALIDRYAEAYASVRAPSLAELRRAMEAVALFAVACHMVETGEECTLGEVRLEKGELKGDVAELWQQMRQTREDVEEAVRGLRQFRSSANKQKRDAAEGRIEEVLISLAS